MRVLHLPVNWASQTSVLVRALQEIGVEARGLVYNVAAIQASDALQTVIRPSPRRHPVRAAVQGLVWWRALRSAIRWADVVHWHSGYATLPLGLDLGYVASRGKVRVVTFWGSDIRIPEIAAADNPSFAAFLAQPDRRYAISYRRSRATQTRFARHGFECMIPGPELAAYLQRDLFPSYHRTEAGLMLADFAPAYPDPGRARPVVAHMPSNQALKGTQAVLRAVERLRPAHDFEFRLIHGVPRSQALAMLRECDILLDQFVLGAWGTAALEAMALGKPAVCYLKPSVQASLPQDHPFVIADGDSLPEVLGELLRDGQRRLDLGRRSRLYVETYHDALKIAADLLRLYEQLLVSQGRGKHGRR